MAKMWGGRFSKKTNPLVEEFTKSIQFDKKLAKYDCIGSLVHIKVLKKANLLSAKEYKKLYNGLKDILSLIEKKKGKLNIDRKGNFEDIHSYMQYLLEKKLGKVALKLHACRSRNDQVVFDTKFYSKGRLLTVQESLLKVMKSLLKLQEKNVDLYIPGYTHLQHAMPVGLVYHLGVYYSMLERDDKRLESLYDSIKLTMGAGALAGTFVQSSKYNEAVKILKEKNSSIEPTDNPMYTVSDRDFIIEILSALSIVGMHLSRLAEDLILWSTKEFDFIDIDEAFCTGSSLMPQKKNPDVLELIRGNTGKLYANLMSVLVMMKGLPLSYNRDMQLDKEPLFNSFEIIQKELEIMAGLLPKIRFKKENIAKQLEDECLYATDMADYLVQRGVAFKNAHTIIGRLINYKLRTGKEIKKMKDEELKKYHPLLTHKVINKIINPETSVKSKRSIRRKKRQKCMTLNTNTTNFTVNQYR